MAEPIRKFETETTGRSWLHPVAAKQEPHHAKGAAFGKARREEGPGKSQRREIVLRLIEYFKEIPSGLGDP